ncbi:MAG: glycosyltransferase family 39 protein [Anaerolineae bacterium]
MLLLLALGLRLYALEGAPPGLQHDEAFNAHDAQQVLLGNHSLYFPGNYGREALFIYLMAGSIRVLGLNVLAIRLPGVFCGVAGLLLLYLLLRNLFGRRTALLALAAGALSFWHLFDSRLGLRAISLPMLLTLSLYLLWIGFSRRRPLLWTLSGAALGLTLYTYLSARLAPLIIILLVAYLGAFHRDRMRGQWLSLLWLSLAALVVFAPFGLYMLRHPELVNARVDAASMHLDALRAGNPRPLLQSTLATLGMFTFRGDPAWRYNIPGRPLLDPLQGLFFVLGLATSLMRWRDPRRALLVIWLAVMCIPTALSDGAPAQLRAVGALPAVLALPAIGIEELIDGLRARRRERLSIGLLALATVGLAAFGAANVHSYLAEWAQAAEPRRIYEADIAATARYLDALPDRPLVLVSSDFAFDLDRYVLSCELETPHDIKWFDGRQAFVLPAAEDRDVLYVFTASAPLADAVADRYLGNVEPVYQPRDPLGVPVITIYRLSPSLLATLRDISPPNRLAVQVGDDLRLVGYDLDAKAPQNASVRATIYWQPLRPWASGTDTPVFFAHLRDADGNFWGQRDRMGYPAWDWSPGDLAINWFDIPTTGDMPLQPYWVHLGLTASGNALLLQEDDGEALGTEVRLDRPVALTRGATPSTLDALPIPHRTDRMLSDDLSVQGYALPESGHPGETLSLALFWETHARPSADHLRIRLVDETGHTRFESLEPLGPSSYPAGLWEPGSLVRTYQQIALPADLDGGRYTVRVSLADAKGNDVSPVDMESLAEISIEGRARYLELPEPVQHPLEAYLGDAVQLLGYSLEADEVERGGVVHLTLYWKALREMDTSYTVFTHVLGPGNAMVGQVDSTPGGGALPTTGWLEGEVLVDRYAIPIAAEAPPGECLIEVGMYDAATFERLPVTLDGVEDLERRVVLGQIVIR